MLELDKQPRVQLSDLRALFSNCKALRGIVEEKSQEAALPYAEDFDLRRAMIEEYSRYFRRSLSFGKWLTLEVEAEVQTETIEITAFIFRWEYQGSRYGVRVSVEARPSNLGLQASVYYFLCPITGRICRKLYTDGTTLASRYAFPHTYSKRNSSHNWREFMQIWDGMLYLDKCRNRKERYRGKITPHGRKLSRLLVYYGDMEKRILSSLSQAGRPRKDGTGRW